MKQKTNSTRELSLKKGGLAPRLSPQKGGVVVQLSDDHHLGPLLLLGPGALELPPSGSDAAPPAPDLDAPSALERDLDASAEAGRVERRAGTVAGRENERRRWIEENSLEDFELE